MSWSKLNETIRFYAFFTEDGVGATGLAPTFSAYNPNGSLIADDEPATGQSANISGIYSLDGASGNYMSTMESTEIGGGIYWQPLAQAETNGNAFAYRWESNVGTISVDPIIGLTQAGAIPMVVAGQENGLPLVNASGNVGANLLEINNESLEISEDLLDVNVARWRGGIPQELSNGNVSSTISTSGINRDSFSHLDELDNVPSHPYNPLDMTLWLFERSYHKTETTEGTDTIYKADGSTILATGVLSDDGTTFTRTQYEG